MIFMVTTNRHIWEIGIDFNCEFQKFKGSTNKFVISGKPIDETNVKYKSTYHEVEITDKREIGELFDIIKFVPGKHKEMAHCMCVGNVFVTMTNNENKETLKMSIHHCERIRNSIFSTRRRFGITPTNENDAELSNESKVSLRKYLISKNIQAD